MGGGQARREEADVRDLDPVIPRGHKGQFAGCPQDNHKLHTISPKAPRGLDFPPLLDGVLLPSQGGGGAQDPLRALLPRIQVSEREG